MYGFTPAFINLTKKIPIFENVSIFKSDATPLQIICQNSHQSSYNLYIIIHPIPV